MSIQATKAPRIPFPKLGVQITVFRDLIRENGGEENFRGLTTTDVCNKYIKPVVGQVSYCEYLRKQPSRRSLVGDGNVFVSHAWKYFYLDVVSALESHFSSDLYIWFDLFSNNQVVAPNLDFDWWSTTFLEAIASFGYVVMVLAPWNDPIPFTRAWCLFELYCCVKCNAKFEVAMSSIEEDTFLREITVNNSKYLSMLGDINVNKSEAWNPEDLRRIMEVVSSIDGGASTINSMVCGKMRTWVLECIKKNVEDSALKENQRIARMLAQGAILLDQGSPTDARECYQRCLDLLKTIEDEPSPNIGGAYYGLGLAALDSGDKRTAKSMLENALPQYIESVGKEDIDVGGIYRALGNYSFFYCLNASFM